MAQCLSAQSRSARFFSVLTTSPPSVFVAGRLTEDALEGSYARAFRGLGSNVTAWNFYEALDRWARFGGAGRYFNRVLPVETWVAKANRDLILAAAEAKPDILLVFGTARVSAGALSQLRAMLPHLKQVLIWPDSLLYCQSTTIAALPLYDLVATYSKASVEPFRLLGARSPAWVPLAFDPGLHEFQEPALISEYADCDASFIGNHTPEREALAIRLLAAGIRIRVWGPSDWRRSCSDRTALRKYWQGRPLTGKEFSLAMRSAPVSLNPINPVTYPAANMRFFEIPGCGGVSVSARAPELEADFPDSQACHYYNNEADVAAVIRKILGDRDAARRVASAAHARVLESHTYRHRALRILELLKQL